MKMPKWLFATAAWQSAIFAVLVFTTTRNQGLDQALGYAALAYGAAYWSRMILYLGAAMLEEIKALRIAMERRTLSL